ncbi:hypothetical protein CALCODRAFT_517667 [Calocera cornea HHB12733]|uniref:F-box domain-containing protein n=1 Tax=Calocera cornea HHB12733 TaxID=1353952 RepID=A0A165FU41_9BASI|nr:hypothetical protein CALCODRAFT_517667 [Calocera cornea HHB12733]
MGYVDLSLPESSALVHINERASMPPTATIYALPTELIGEILEAWQALDPSAPESAVRVCRPWRSIALSMSTLWRVLTLDSHASAGVKVPLWHARSHGRLEHLRLVANACPKYFPIFGTLLDSVQLARLRSLECRLPEWLRYDVLGRMPLLQNLRVVISGTPLHLRWELLAGLESLQILDLVNAYPQDDRPLPFPNLRVVRLQCHEGAHLLRFLLKTCGGLPLEEAALSLRQAGDKAITHPNERDLVNLGSARCDYLALRHLRVEGKMDWHLLTSRLYLPELCTIVMDDFPSPSAAACFGDLRPLEAPIRSLTISTHDHLAIEEGLSILIQLEGVPTLEHLRITGYLSDTFLDGLGEACQPNLAHIDLSGCEGVSPAAAVRLAIARIESGHPLRIITLDGCQWVTPDVIPVLQDIGPAVEYSTRIAPTVPRGWRNWTFVNN